MVTHFLGAPEVHGYLADFLTRLLRVDPVPLVWCPLTRSGRKLANEIGKILKRGDARFAVFESVELVPLGLAKKTKKVTVARGMRPELEGKNVLVLDSSIHSGGTMRRAVGEVLKAGAKNVCSYSLVVMRGSEFFPTVWGVIIDDSDRAFFLLDEIPNQRLHAGADARSQSATEKPQAYVHIRRLSKGDKSQTQLKTGLRSLDRFTWGDRLFDMESAGGGRCTYVLETGESPVGFITLTHEDRILFIQEIGIGKKFQGCGKPYGPILMRFAETMARQLNCTTLRLYGVEERVEFYEGFGYRRLPEAEALELDSKRYIMMEKAVLHQTPFT